MVQYKARANLSLKSFHWGICSYNEAQFIHFVSPNYLLKLVFKDKKGFGARKRPFGEEC